MKTLYPITLFLVPLLLSATPALYASQKEAKEVTRGQVSSLNCPALGEYQENDLPFASVVIHFPNSPDAQTKDLLDRFTRYLEQEHKRISATAPSAQGSISITAIPAPSTATAVAPSPQSTSSIAFSAATAVATTAPQRAVTHADAHTIQSTSSITATPAPAAAAIGTAPATSIPATAHNIDPQVVEKIKKLKEELALLPTMNMQQTQALFATHMSRYHPILFFQTILPQAKQEYLRRWQEKLESSVTSTSTLRDLSAQNGLAQRNEAICYEHGMNDREQNLKQALTLYEQAAKNGDALSQVYLAINCLVTQKKELHQKAVIFLRKAAVQLEEAKTLLIYCYQYGIGTPANATAANMMLDLCKDPESVPLELDYLRHKIRLGF